MIKNALAASAITLAAVPVAHAQDIPRGYAALGYTRIDTGQASLGAVTARAGWKLLPNAGVEAEAGFGVEDHAFDVSIGGSGGVLELEHEVAAYAVAFLPLGRNLEVFARAGYGSTEIEASAAGVTPKGDGDSFNYGAGAAFYYRADGVRAEWTRKDFADGGEADAWSVSYVRRF